MDHYLSIGFLEAGALSLVGLSGMMYGPIEAFEERQANEGEWSGEVTRWMRVVNLLEQLDIRTKSASEETRGRLKGFANPREG